MDYQSVLSELAPRTLYPIDIPKGAPPRSSNVRPANVVSRVIRGFDPDQLRDAFQLCDIEHRLLEPGTFEAHLLCATSAKVALQIFRYSVPVALSAAWPRDRVAILFGFEVGEGAVMQGQPFQGGALVVFDGTSDMSCRLPAGAICAALIVEREFLAAVGRREGFAIDQSGTPIGTPVLGREREVRHLKGLVRSLLDDLDLTSELQQTPALSLLLEREVLKAYLNALAVSERSRTRSFSVLDRRNRLVKKAETYILAHLDQSIRIQTLSREVGASPRALEYAFAGVYGMGAMRYLRTIRLNEVRKALLRSHPSECATVTSAAMDWGFWHLGEFAAAYRRLFGEAPSETLGTTISGKQMIGDLGETHRSGPIDF